MPGRVSQFEQTGNSGTARRRQGKSGVGVVVEGMGNYTRCTLAHRVTGWTNSVLGVESAVFRLQQLCKNIVFSARITVIEN